MLLGKVLLVTGASRGIGRAAALMAAENHAHVIINYNKSEEQASELMDQLLERGLHSSMIRADVSSEEDVKAMFKYIKEEHSRLDVLVNNAGVMKNSLLALSNTELFDQTIGVNLKGMFLCTRYAANMMRKQRYGRIINLSSTAGLNGDAGQTVYSANKAAVVGFTRSVAKELGMYGITVNAIAPGLIETDLIKDIKAETREKILSNIALGRIGTPEDVAKVILFLSSDLGDYVSGEVIVVDGCQIM
ncbi:3-oxoacyl-ACP reductase family protein [Methanolobus sp.]|uniref:3-oxoacyl-ACP reductase family protein n=1 Tax=Methanolobus sp. TaxID=1874737 RepID=UPI0025D5A4D4|nr:3-oxoacyl-ACP reductase family protein [Methanolobus sp.]